MANGAETVVDSAHVIIVAIRIKGAFGFQARRVTLSNESRRAKARERSADTVPAMLLSRISNTGASNGNLYATSQRVTVGRHAEVGRGLAGLGALLAAATTEETSISAQIVGIAFSGRHALTALAKTTASRGVTECSGNRAANGSNNAGLTTFFLLIPILA